MKANLRPYRSGDATQVVELSLRAWEPVFKALEAALGAEIFRRLHSDWRVDQRRAVEEVLAGEEMTVWVADLGPSVAGFVAVRLHREAGLGEAHMLAVDPPYPNDGIGEQLTLLACDWIRDQGMGVAMVETGGDPGHAPARRTYEKAGFSLVPVARYFKAL